jgi:hypothetical protein
LIRTNIHVYITLIYNLIHVWEEERWIRGFGGKLAGQTALGRPRRRLEDNIEIDLQEMEVGGGGGGGVLD